MNVFFFHLMPYAYLDLDYDQKHASVMCTLPNAYYDPQLGHELYNRYLDELEYAEQVGFDGICVNEHHQTAYGMMPSPIVTASALSRRTSRAKIAILGTAFCLRDNPILQAEEHAMIDNITGGRLITGMVRGIGAEYYSTMANPAHSRERFQEAHDLVIRAWSEPGPFRFYGKHYKFDYVNIWPRPYQQPHPPVWLPSQGSIETIEYALEKRHTYLQTYTPWASVQKYLNMCHDMARERYGYELPDEQVGWALPCYVAETDEQARAEAKEHIENLFNKFINIPPHMLLPPGYVSTRAMRGFIESTKDQVGRKPTMEDMIDNGMFVCGSPETVVRTFKERYAQAPLGNLLLLSQFATLPADLTRKCLTLLGEQVLPQVREIGAEGRRASA